MSNFFNEFSDKSSCQNSGMCSVDPSSYALEELLLNEIKQIAFYVVKLADYNLQNMDIAQSAVNALSVIIINTALRFEDYKNLLYKLEAQKTSIKEEYLKCCTERKIKYELVENAIKLPKTPSLTNILKAGESIVIEKRNEYEPKKLDLIELIIIFAKTTSANLIKLKNLGFSNPEWNYKVLKFLNLTNISSIKKDKLIDKICKFSNFAFEIWKKLIEQLEKRYGKRTECTIPFEIKEGKSILVSGSDLDELEKLLDAVNGTNINVYTNSSLFTAFCYPYFSKYKNLIAHFGGENAANDFANFKGPIFATENFLQKVDYLRRGTIYTTKLIAPERMVRITDYNFTPMIENALNSEGFTPADAKTRESVTLKYNLEEIDKIIKNTADKEICVIVGSYKKEEITKRFANYALIELESPVEIQLVVHILSTAQAEKLNFVFTHCSPNTINMLLSTLHSAPKKIYFAKCPNSLINPHIIRALTDEFNVEVL